MSEQSHLSYQHTPLTEAYLYETIPQRLQHFADTTPDKTAVVIISPSGERESITCHELLDTSTKFAKGLHVLGIKRGNRIGILLDNSIGWLVSSFGTLIIGAIPVYFSFERLDGTDAAAALKSVQDCTVLIVEPGKNDINWNVSKNFIKYDIRAKGVAISEMLPSLRTVICSKLPQDKATPYLIDEIVSIGTGQKDDPPFPDISPDDPCAIFLSSGSTGAQKAVYRSHLSMVMAGKEICNKMGCEESDIFYNERAFTWVGGYPNRFLYKGITIVTIPNMIGFTSIENLISFEISNIQKEKCTMAILFPVVLHAILKDVPKCDQWPLKAIQASGAPIAKSNAKAACKIAKKFVTLYGCTEIGNVSMQSVENESDFENFDCGKPLPGIEMKIVDDDGKTLPVNTTGELLVRHYIRFMGYQNFPSLTDEVYSPTGWFKTDDIGFVNQKGNFIIGGRKSEMMIIGGKLTFPSTVEANIKDYCEVEEACVVPIDDDLFFQQMCACIVLKQGSSATRDTIIESMESQVIYFSHILDCPRYFMFLDSLPKTSTGKVSRKQVLEIAKKNIQEGKFC